jgi:hypothetical protein
MTEIKELNRNIQNLKPIYLVFALFLAGSLAAAAEEKVDLSATPEASTSLPAGESQPEPPKPAETPKLHSRWRKKEIELPAWPGRFVALRSGLSAGEILVPFASGSGFSSGGASNTVTSFTSAAPIIGVELGYCPQNWGVSFSIDWAPFGLLSADFFSGAPSQLLVTLNLLYAPNDWLRWDFGFEPYNTYSVGLPDNGSARINGVGLKVGAHFRLSDRASNVWAIFVSGSAGVLREVDATVNGATSSVGPATPGFGGTFMGYFALTSGLEWDFSL